MPEHRDDDHLAPGARRTGTRQFTRRSGTSPVLVAEVTRPGRTPWLLFAAMREAGSGLERRRLQPFPDDWRQLPDAEIETLHDRATPVAATPVAASPVAASPVAASPVAGPRPRPAAPRAEAARAPAAEGLAEKLAFALAQLAAARDQIAELEDVIHDYEARLGAADEELDAFNAELQALYERLGE
jgi:hypothetical protein